MSDDEFNKDLKISTCIEQGRYFCQVEHSGAIMTFETDSLYKKGFKKAVASLKHLNAMMKCKEGS